MPTQHRRSAQSSHWSQSSQATIFSPPLILFSSLRQEHCSILSCRDERMKWFDTEESLRVVAQSKSGCRCRGPVKRLRHDRAWRSLTVKMGGDRCMLTDVLGGFAPIPEMSPDLQFCIDKMRMYVNRGLPCIRFQTMTYARKRTCQWVGWIMETPK